MVIKLLDRHNSLIDKSLDWRIPIIGFDLYAAAVIIGYFLENPLLNIVGFIFLVFVLLIGNYQKMFTIRFDLTIGIAFLIVIFIFINISLNSDYVQFKSIFKQIAIFVLYSLIYSYSYPPIQESPRKKYFYISIFFILLISIMWGTNFELGEERRATGIFTNPNNLSLMTLSLLFFLNDKKDSTKFHIIINIIVIIFLVITNTTGALMAYFIANIYRFRTNLSQSKKTIIFILIMLALIILILTYFDYINYIVTKKIINQLLAVKEYIHDSLYEGHVNYYKITVKYGYSSAVWRLEQWRKTLSVIRSSNILNIFFGHGIGSSKIYIDNLPHNEYLRILFEQGLIGFVIIMSFFLTIYHRISIQYRYLVLIFAIYSFTENNLDNILFMTLFIMFVATSQVCEQYRKVGL